MSDEENQREVDRLLGSIMATRRELLRIQEAFINAAEAFLDAVERDRYSPHLGDLSDQVHFANDAAVDLGWHQQELIEDLRRVLARWKRPGRDYVEFIRKARDAAQFYWDALRESANEFNKAMDEINRIDEAATGRR
jgi:hypothetical protein